MTELESIADYGCQIGEGPLWHPDERCLYWIDIPNGRLFRYDPKSKAHNEVYKQNVIGGFTIQEDGSLLLFGEQGNVTNWEDGSIETVIEEIPGEKDSRFNDVIADPKGRVFCGTMPTEDRLGRIYRLDSEGTIQAVVTNVNLPNGLAFTPDRKKLYLTESNTRTIYLFDYDIETGSLSNQRTLLETSERKGGPDGMTVDTEGFIWSARWNAGALIRYTPNGKEERRINFPVKKVSSVTFGGEEYSEIYVTTAGGDQKETEGLGAGALFRFNLGIKGYPEFRSRIQLN